MEYEGKPRHVRGLHAAPGQMAHDHRHWVDEFLKMDISVVKLVDDGGGSCISFAKEWAARGGVSVVRLYRERPNPGLLPPKAIATIGRYISERITRWFEGNNEPNLPCEWKEGSRPDDIKENAKAVMLDWMADAATIIGLGGYPAFPALAQCSLHRECSSIRWYEAAFAFLANNHYNQAKKLFSSGAWIASHDAVLNHIFIDDQGRFRFDYPYDPNCQLRHPGRRIMDDDNSLIGHQVPVRLLWDYFGMTVPVMSTEGGVFYKKEHWDKNYPPMDGEWTHAVWTVKMFEWLARYRARYPWYLAMMPWLACDVVCGCPPSAWAGECWFQPGKTLQVVGELKKYPQTVKDDPLPPKEYGESIGNDGSTPKPPLPPLPPPPPPPPPVPSGFPRPPGDNGLGMHMGLGTRLVGSALAEDIARLKELRCTWAVVAFGAGEDVMLDAAKKLWANGIMPVVRKVGNIEPIYDYGRDARLLVQNGIPAYVQIFNEPGDLREWESEKKQKKHYNSGNWCGWWIDKAKDVIAAGGYPGFQCLHPKELQWLFDRLPASDPIWKRMWFCSHNYGLNHPPAWEGDQWCVLGFKLFAKMFQGYLGFVPPVICGEGGWLFNAYDDHRYPVVGATLHAKYHKEIFEWFRLGKMSDGAPLPDWLFAVCPWILSGMGDEPWYGGVRKTMTIEAVKAIPKFTRFAGPQPEPGPEPAPKPPLDKLREMAMSWLVGMPVPWTFALPAYAKKRGYTVQGRQGRYLDADTGVHWAWQVFANGGQTEYVVVYAPEGRWGLIDHMVVKKI